MRFISSSLFALFILVGASVMFTKLAPPPSQTAAVIEAVTPQSEQEASPESTSEKSSPSTQGEKTAADVTANTAVRKGRVLGESTQSPILERITETIREISGVTFRDLTALEERINTRISNQISPPPFPQYIGGGGQGGVAAAAASQRIDQLNGVTIHNPIIVGGSISGTSGASSGIGDNASTTSFYAAIGHFVNGVVDTLSSTVANLGTLTATNSTLTQATSTYFAATIASTTNLSTGALTLGSSSGVLNSTGGVVAPILNGSNGQVLKMVSGTPSWASDLVGSGGSSAWATTTDNLAVYTADSTQVVLVGTNATSSLGQAFEVKGNTLLRGNQTTHGSITASSFSATSSATSTFAGGLSILHITQTGTATSTFAAGIESPFIGAQYFVGTSTATSTFTGGIRTALLNVTGSATSSASNGWNISSGCYAIGNACLSFSTLAGQLNLATQVTGTLGVGNGGTGSTTLSGLLKGNGTGQVATAVAGTDYVLPSQLFAYLFPGNATTTGLGIYGSTTIGAGSAITGLTINGGATTTGHFKLFGSAANVSLGANYLSGDGDDEGIIIDASGNVGIGTVTPSEKIEIAGNLMLADNSSSNRSISIKTPPGTGAAGTDLYITAGANEGSTPNAGGDIRINGGSGNGGSYGDVILANLGGNVGIGTTTPWGKLSITNSGTDPSLIVEDSASPDATPFIVTSTGDVGIGTSSPTNTLHVFTGESGTDAQAAADDLVIESSANVGVALLTTDALSSTINFGSPSDNIGSHLTWNYNTSEMRLGTSKTGASLILESGNGSDAARIASDGKFGVGTTSPWRTLSVTGTLGLDGLTGATGAGSLCLDSNKQVVYNSASDSCLSSTRATKHAINTLSFDALELVDRLDPVSFVYNEGDGRPRYGFIAEDAASVDAHLATYNASSSVSGIDDRAMISVIVKAVKELWHRLLALISQVAGHDSRIASLEHKVAQLEAQLAASAGTSPQQVPSSSVINSDTIPPTITIQGNNPATVSIGDVYADLGVVVTDNQDSNPTLELYLDGNRVDVVSIDTTNPIEHRVDYIATDDFGNTATSSRTILVQ